MGLGMISSDFCCSLVANGSDISAVAARDVDKAQAFADKFHAKRAHGSYQALADDPEVDIVYVGTIHPAHLGNVTMALEAGKHVVCEKPLGINSAEVQKMVDLARSKKLFLMEAMWTRCFPAIRKVREVLAAGEIGEPQLVQGDFGFVAPSEDTPHRLWDPEQAGGAMLDIGCYLVQAAVMAFGPTVPEQIACTGRLAKTGVDKEGLVSLTWADKGSASLMFTLTSNTPEQLRIIGSNGYLVVDTPAHCPVKVTVAKACARGQFEEEVFAFDLPKVPEGYSVNFPNSEGFLYEVQAAEKALREGQLECPDYTLEESLVVTQIMDKFREQLGVVYPSEK
eukprot:TRINITY_DN57535_c0_g1_i1.p1 TRINITY_DN57535_c0_g1~~TRINITY_DN57535_c0_g1_i1.p1  ORF type:complete len:368 (+),score=38.30 TRINITY_DN57535_c0_g1_i1:91-1104(+)